MISVFFVMHQPVFWHEESVVKMDCNRCQLQSLNNWAREAK